MYKNIRSKNYLFFAFLFEYKYSINLGKEISNMFSEKNKIQINNEKDYFLIDIKEECSFIEYIEKLENYKDEKILIPTRMFILDSSDFIDSKLQKQKICYFSNLGFEYIITLSDNKIKISQRNIEGKHIHETMLVIDDSNEYSITKYIHDSNNKIKVCEEYINNNSKDKLLDKKEAIFLAQYLLDNLKNMSTLYKIINIYYIYRKLNLIPNTWYNPIVSDDVITLSSPRYSSIGTINNIGNGILNIVLNETKEQIGNVIFNFKKEGITYDGNIGYEIKEKFKNSDYAIRALNLLKEIVKSNKFITDKQIYISIIDDDINYQKEIEESDGKIVYDGVVPEDNKLNRAHGIPKVKIYQININDKVQINT